MQFMLLLYSDETGWTRLTRADQKKWMAEYDAFAEALRKAGALRAGNHLESITQTQTVRVAKGRMQISEGPSTASKEQLAGYFVVEVADREAAIAWAQRCPGARHGVVEVRPIGVPPA